MEVLLATFFVCCKRGGGRVVLKQKKSVEDSIYEVLITELSQSYYWRKSEIVCDVRVSVLYCARQVARQVAYTAGYYLFYLNSTLKVNTVGHLTSLLL